MVNIKADACTVAINLRHRAEEQLKAQTAEISITTADSELMRLFHEQQVYQVELELQNEELRQSRLELDTVLLRYTDLYDFAPISYFTLNQLGYVRSANLTGATLLGIDRSLLLGRRLGLFVAPEYRPDYADFIEKIFLTRVKESCELVLIAGGHSRIDVQLEAIVYGEAQECRIVVNDISARKRLEESNAHLALFAQLDPNPILEVEFSGLIKYSNPATLKVLESIGMSADDAGLFIPGDFKVNTQKWDRCSEKEYTHEVVINGRYFKESLYLSPRLNAARIYAFDCTEQKVADKKLADVHAELEQRVLDRTSQLSTTVQDLISAEDNLHKLNRLYLILSETGKAIASISDRNELFRAICRIAVEQGGFRMVWVGLLEGESGLIKPAEAFGFSTDYLEIVKISTLAEAEGRGPLGIVVRLGGHYICNDFMTDPNTGPWQAEAEKRGFLAAAAFAITLQGKIIGALTMYAGVKNYFDQPKIDLLLQMQSDISFALDNMARDTRRRETEAALQTEIADRLQVVEELRQKELLLLQQSRQAAMGEMISNIAHQWRQPLNALGLIIQKISLFYDSPGCSKKFLEHNSDKAMQLIQHMSQTIESFRDFFRTDKEKVLIELNDLVLRMIALINQTFYDQKIAITFKAAGSPKIYGYPNEYAQVILIILFNSLDQLLGNCVEKARIVITTFMTEKTTELIITDNAGGVDDDILGKLFEPYFTTKGPDKGTGIGLFMAKTIIETNMGGRLTVRNVKNGAQFMIEVQNDNY